MAQTTLNELFYKLWFLFPLLSFLSIPAFIFIIWRSGKRTVICFIIFMALESCLAALYTVHTFGGAFGTGITIFFLSFVVFLLSLIMLASMHGRFYRRFSEDKLRKKVYIRGGLLLLLMQFSPQ